MGVLLPSSPNILKFSQMIQFGPDYFGMQRMNPGIPVAQGTNVYVVHDFQQGAVPGYQNNVPAQGNAQEVKAPDALRNSIQLVVRFLENSGGIPQAITLLSARFMIKRRRLYDVINVFESIGACQKSGLDSVKWLGLENMKETFRVMRKQRGIDNPAIPLEELFPAPYCVGISNLTASLLLLFAALKTNRLDLRYVSQFFSHGTARYKTTLCKLYQICYILGAIGVTRRTLQVCEVVLNDEFCDPDVEKGGSGEKKGPEHVMSISALLNKDKECSDWLAARRKRLRSSCIENATDPSTL